jgi:hypothetical protein
MWSPAQKGFPMILARTESAWLKRYLKDSGGALTVTLRTMVVT